MEGIFVLLLLYYLYCWLLIIRNGLVGVLSWESMTVMNLIPFNIPSKLPNKLSKNKSNCSASKIYFYVLPFIGSCFSASIFSYIYYYKLSSYYNTWVVLIFPLLKMWSASFIIMFYNFVSWLSNYGYYITYFYASYRSYNSLIFKFIVS